MLLVDKVSDIVRRSRKTRPSRHIGRQWFNHARANSGIVVDEEQALAYSAVYRAVQLLATSVAMLPGSVVKRLANGDRERLADHGATVMMGRMPNGEQTPFTFKECMTSYLARWGNAYAELVDSASGRGWQAWPLRPDKVTVMRDEKTYQLFYRYEVDTEKWVDLMPERVLHLRLGGDAEVGKSPIRLARESIGLGIATEMHGAGFFGNGAAITGILQHPDHLSPEAHDNVRRDFENMHRGVVNSHRPAILEEGMEWKPVGIPNDDAQFLETRNFQVREIARWYGIPPHMLGDLERATYNNIEHHAIEYERFTLASWLKRWEEEVDRKLLGNSPDLSYKFNTNALLRGDTKSRNEAYEIQRRNGVINANQWLALEDQNGIGPAGDIFIVESNMQVLDEDMGNTPEPEPAPAAPPVAPEPEPDGNDDDEDRARDAAAIVLREAMGSLVLQECDRLERAIRKGENAGDLPRRIDEFYDGFEGRVVVAFAPAFAAFNTFTEENMNAEQAAREYVAAQRAVLCAAMNGGHDPRGLLEEWRDSRADQVTAMYFGGDTDGA